MLPKYVDVIVDVPAVQGRRFTYSNPGLSALSYGAKVRVPFGRGEADGFVVGEVLSPPPVPIKDIKALYDPEFMPGPELISLASVVADYYCVPLASAMSLLWPPVVPKVRPEEALSGLRRRESPSLEVAPKTLRESPPEPPPEPPSESPSEASTPVLLVQGSEEFRWQEYVRRAQAVRDRGRGVAFLVPEIKGVKEAERRLEAAFPAQVAQLHSDLTGVARRTGYLSLLRGQKTVALGTRSAVFAPVRDLGLIVLEDEPSESYKSPDMPFYDARTVASMRGQIEGCEILVGTSHPSVEAFKKVMEGTWNRVPEQEAPRRPPVALVNLREARRGPRIISPELETRLRTAFASSERAILFQNRRGDATEVSCRDCGQTVLCPRCQIPLSYHARESSLMCHTCGHSHRAPDACPNCGGHNWRFSGFGIGRALAEFRKMFPDVPVFRLDKDVSKEEPAESVMESFSKARPSCLLATRMVLGFPEIPDVATVGMLSCDTLLNLPDYRASEKVFHLLWSVMELVDPLSPGAVFVVQTYNPDHHGVRGIIDPRGFYETELANRRQLGYPPFKSFFRVRFSGKDLGRVSEAASSFAKEALAYGRGIDVLGPSPAAKPKVRGEHRWQVALRGPDHTRLVSLCREAAFLGGRSHAVRVSVDVDPLDMT